MQWAFLFFLVLLLSGAFTMARRKAARERRRQSQRDARAEVERRARKAL